MNAAALLALISDLYSQITALIEENRALRDALSNVGPGDHPPEQNTQGAGE